MPSAATHDRIALYAAGALAVPSYLVLHYGLDMPPTEAYHGTLLLLGAHLFGSWWLSPDLDLDGKIDDRWGPLRPLWVPYMRVMPHRSIFSHSGLSGVLRLLYLYGIIMAILALLSYGARLIQVDASYHTDFTNWLLAAFRSDANPAWLLLAGIIISDLTHVAADLIDTRRKRLWRGQGSRRRR
jgi:uncharacterized metal-binding protein